MHRLPSRSKRTATRCPYTTLFRSLAFLLAAEVVAATAVVSEAALVYVARHRNLLLSLATLGLQAVLSVALILTAQAMGLPPIYYAGDRKSTRLNSSH